MLSAALAVLIYGAILLVAGVHRRNDSLTMVGFITLMVGMIACIALAFDALRAEGVIP